jgi:hypothetical protein
MISGMRTRRRNDVAVVKKAALQCNSLNDSDVSVTRNRLCTELSTETGDMRDPMQWLAAGYFGASGQRPVIGPKASSPVITLTTLK